MSDPINTLDDAIRRAVRAVADAPEEAPELHSLRDIAFRARKLHRAWGRPQCLGFFGPSQAGKSFLVGALLSHELGSLEVETRSGPLDFLEEINPAKGVESTGVVTRFSTGPAPVELRRGDFFCRLLSLEVMLESMATGFLVECTAPPVDVDRVERCLRDGRLSQGTPAPPLFAEAWETVFHNLVKKYQDRHPYVNELRKNVAIRGEQWKKGIASIEGWLHVYSLLWGGHGYAKDLDNLARRLVDGLEMLGQGESVEVEVGHVRASSDGASIIDAACLNSLGQTGRTIRVFPHASGRDVSIDPGVLAALIAEIRLQHRPVRGSLFENTDLLDFPGGRALRGINGFGPKELNSGSLDNAIEVFKRGKLTFLFEQFSLDREITSLVLCSPGPTKPEAIQLQSQVERWLQIRHGASTPVDKDELEHPSLFMALTKFDMSLGSLRSDNAKDRWDSRVREACVEFWARNQGSWILNWGAKGRAFDNMFWVQNPYADQMSALAPEDSDYALVKQGYFDSPAIQRFIARPDEKWAAVEGKDEGGKAKSGVSLLASHLRQKLAEDIKKKELVAEAKALRSELLDVLKALTPSQNEAEERARLTQAAEHLVEAVRLEMGRTYSGAVFGELVSLLAAPREEVEAELRAIHGVVAPMSIKTSDKVKKVLVHLLKWWAARAIDSLRESHLELPAAHVERFVREVCTSKLIMPIVGKAVFPYFSRTRVDYTLIATILRVKICDSLLDLFKEPPRSTASIPVRLSYSESADAVRGESDGDGEGAAIDWGDVDFDEESAADIGGDVEIVFAGNRYFHHWAEELPGLYLKNGGLKAQTQADDPRVRELVAILGEVEASAVASS
jgi:hypothetical protein